MFPYFYFRSGLRRYKKSHVCLRILLLMAKSATFLFIKQLLFLTHEVYDLHKPWNMRMSQYTIDHLSKHQMSYFRNILFATPS